MTIKQPVGGIVCVGHVGRDAEERMVKDGQSVVSFSVGVKAGEWQTAQIWSGSSFYDDAKSVRKGDLVRVCGRLQETRSYTNKSGESVTVQDMTAEWLDIRHKSASAPTRSAPVATAKPSLMPDPAAMDEDDLPF